MKVPTLQMICTEIIVKHIDLVESFGVIPTEVQVNVSMKGHMSCSKHTISSLLARHRKWNENTLALFLEPDLMSLSLNNCEGLTSTTISSIAKCQKLEKLSLAGCGRLVDDALVEIAHKCGQLKDVTLNGY